jgi:precorrin-6Y C5,15-methyltransferase (decarboxylating)
MRVLDRICREKGTFVVYCDKKQTPLIVARYLLERDSGLASCTAWLFENLGTREEKISRCSLGRIPKKSFSSMTMMIVRRDHSREAFPAGIPDSMFAHEKGMITRRDIRLMTVSRLGLHRCSTLWDVGAGCGSVSIEAANIMPGLSVYAVERRRARYEAMLKNIAAFGMTNVTAVLGTAPEALKKIPTPDSIFIGGSGGDIHGILSYCARRLNRPGKIVLNCVTLDTLTEVVSFCRKRRWQYGVVSAQLSRTESAFSPAILRAENPVHIVTLSPPIPKE